MSAPPPHPPLVLAALKLLRLVAGTNPWPSASWQGHAATSVMLLTSIVLIAAQVPLIANGRLPIRGTDPAFQMPDDFMAYLAGAQLLASGQAPKLYDVAAHFEVQRTMLGAAGAGLTTPNAFVNPPLWAAIVALLLPLGAYGASYAWRAVFVALAAIPLSWVTAPRSGQAVLALLCFGPLVQSWLIGSMTPVLVLAVSGWLALVIRGRLALGGAVLSLLLLKPQYIVVPLVYLAWKRQWAQLGGFAAGAAIQGTLTLALLGATGGLPSLGLLIELGTLHGGSTGAGVLNHVSLRAALLHLLPGLTTTVHLLALAVLTVIVLALLLRGWSRQMPASDLALGWETLAMLAATGLLAYHNHASGLALVLPAAAIVLTRSGADKRLSWLTVALAAPSLPLLYAGIEQGPYVMAAWVSTLACIAIGFWRRGTSGSGVFPRASGS